MYQPKHAKLNPWPRRVAALGATVLALASVPSVAFADDISIVQSTVSGSPGQVVGFDVGLLPGASDNGNNDPVGCNASVLKPVRISFASNNSAVADAPAFVDVTDCVTTQAVAVSIKSSAVGGTSTVLSASATGGAATIKPNGPGNSQLNADSVTISVVGKSNQTALTINATSPQTYGATQALTTSGGSSGGTVTYTSTTPTVCSVNAANLTMLTGTGSCGVTATMAGNTTYNDVTSAVKTITAAKATTTTSVSCPSDTTTYTGSALAPCSAAVTGVNGLNQSLTPTYSNNTNVGTGTAAASYAGTTDYAASSDSKTFSIGKAPSTVTVTCPSSAAYTGSALTPCSAGVTSAGDVDQPLTVSYSGNTDVGTANASATYAGDSNHSSGLASKGFSITQAATVVSVTCPTSVTYTGAALTPCSAKVTGGGLDQAVDVAYSANTVAGTAGASASYAGDANHAAANGGTTFEIAKAASVTTVSCPDNATYTGSALTPCSAVATGAGPLSASVTPTYGANTAVGEASASATYAGDANHTGSSGSDTFDILKATSTTTVTCSAGSSYDGTPKTPCSAGVVGAGGLSQSLTVAYTDNTGAGTAGASATYAGDGNHEGSSDATTFSIAKAITATAVTCPAEALTYTGEELRPCSAVTTGPGALDRTLTVDYTDNTDAGTAGASAAFPAEDNYAASSDSDTFTIAKAGSTTELVCGSGGSYTGTAKTPCTAAATGVALNTPVDVTYSANTHAGTATATATFAGDANHTGSSDSDHFEIAKATTTTTVTCSSDAADYTFTGSALTPCTAAVTGPADLDESLIVSYEDNVNVGEASASAAYAGTDDYEPSQDGDTFEISKADSHVTITCDEAGSYDGSAKTPCTADVTGAGGLKTTAEVTYEDNVDAGTATAKASYDGDANHDGSEDTDTFEIAKAATTTVVTCETGSTYDGSPQTPCSARVTGPGDLDESLTVSYGSNTDAGSATASAEYTESDNYLGSSDSEGFSIAKATSTTTVSCPEEGVTYDGAPQAPCTAVATGAGALLENLTVTHTNNTNAGTANAAAGYAGDTNHTGSSGSGTFSIAKASSSTTVTCTSGGTYTGSAKTPCTAEVTGAGGLKQAVTVSYEGNTDAGTATASAVFGGDSNHNGSSDTETFQIGQAPLQVTASSAAVKKGAAVPAISPQYSGFVGTEDKNVLDTAPSCTTTYTTTSDVGSYPSTCSGLVDGNYAAGYVAGSVTVTYLRSGFGQPVDGTYTTPTPATPVFNTAKAGSAIPVKFDLGGNMGLDIWLNGIAPTTKQVTCTTTSPLDNIEELATGTTSGLKYDATAGANGQYNYTWKTSSGWAGTCQRLTVTLKDGTSHYAFFKFAK